MATRSKPYTLKLGILDVFLILISQGGWLLIMVPRELYRFFGPQDPTI